MTREVSNHPILKVGQFPGQGSQSLGMGRALRETFPEAQEVYEIASESTGIDVVALCERTSEDYLAQTQNAQLAIVTVSVAAWRVWDERVRESERDTVAFCGHSIGALSAAIACGALTIAEGTRLARSRGLLMSQAPGRGSMLAVAVGSVQNRRDTLRIAEECGLDVAAYNGDRQLVLSGRVEGVAVAHERLGARSRPLRVSHGFHSRLMDPILPGWSQLLNEVTFKPGRSGYLGSASGQLAGSPEQVREDLRGGLRSPVRWDRVLKRTAKSPQWAVFGPGRALVGLGRRGVPGVAPITIDDAYARNARKS